MRSAVFVWCAAVCAQAAELQVQPSSVAGARAGYVSLQVIAKLRAAAEYSQELTPVAGLQVDVFREWYHTLERNKAVYPDALIPVHLPYRSRLPEADNRIADQKAQAFWVDLWIPADARPGEYPLRLRLTSGRKATSTP